MTVDSASDSDDDAPVDLHTGAPSWSRRCSWCVLFLLAVAWAVGVPIALAWAEQRSAFIDRVYHALASDGDAGSYGRPSKHESLVVLDGTPLDLSTQSRLQNQLVLITATLDCTQALPLPALALQLPNTVWATVWEEEIAEYGRLCGVRVCMCVCLEDGT